MTEGDYVAQVREVQRIAAQLGTWVLHGVAEEEELLYFVGYLRYRIADFNRRRNRCAVDGARRRYLTRRISYWRRALRWVTSLEPETARHLVDRLLEDLRTARDEYAYVAEHECSDPRHDRDQRSRKSEQWKPGVGRPRAEVSRRAKRSLCGNCRGMGTVKGTQ